MSKSGAEPGLANTESSCNLDDLAVPKGGAVVGR